MALNTIYILNVPKFIPSALHVPSNFSHLHPIDYIFIWLSHRQVKLNSCKIKNFHYSCIHSLLYNIYFPLNIFHLNKWHQVCHPIQQELMSIVLRKYSYTPGHFFLNELMLSIFSCLTYCSILLSSLSAFFGNILQPLVHWEQE